MATAVRSPQSLQPPASTWRAPWHLLAALSLAALTAHVALDAGVLMSVNTPAASPGVPIQITGTGFSTIASQNVLTVIPSSGAAARTSAATAVQTLDATRGIRRLNVLVPADLPAGSATLRITNSATGEISEGLSFEVVHIAVSGTTTAAPGTTGVEVVVEGSPNAQFTDDGATRVTVGAGIVVRSVAVHSPHRLTAVLDIASSAAFGPRPVAVRPRNQFLLLADGFVVGTPPPVNRDPRVTSTPVTQAVVGQTYAYQVEVVDDDGDEVGLALQQAPSGMTLMEGTLHWTPASSQTGPHSVTLLASDGRGGSATQSFEVVVAAPPLVAITLTPAYSRFTAANDTRQFTVSGLRADGSTVDLTAGAAGTTYQTSNGAVASVSAEGVLTALANGETTITARHLALTATAIAIVEQGVTLEGLALTPATATLRAIPATHALTLRGHFSDDTDRDLTADPGTRYQSSDESVATVDASGVVSPLAPGVVTLTAFHDTHTATAELRIELSSGEGFVRGQVFDDSRGLPLVGATVSLLSDGGGSYDQPPTTLSDDRGRYVLRARSGDVVLRVVKPGFTTVERQGTVSAGGRLRVLDARLTPEDTNETPVRSAFGAQLGNAVRTITLDLPPGALPTDLAMRLTSIGAQGLAGRLPIGWSPIGAVDISPAGPLFQPAMLTVPNAATVSPATTVTAVGYDAAAHRWRVIGAAQLAADGRTLSTTITSAGQIAFVVGDDAPFTPPLPMPGQPLAGVDEAALPAMLEASGEVVPRSAPPGESARAIGRIGLASGTAMPSGTAVQVHVNETFDLLDTSRVEPLPFTQDILVHARPRPPSGSRLAATFPITPSRAYTIQQLMHGVVALDVTRPDPDAAAGVIGAGGGAQANEHGDLLVVPAGALPIDTLISLHRVAAPLLPSGFPPGHDVLAAIDVDFVGAPFATPAQLSITRPGGLGVADQVIVAQRIIDPAGVQRLRIVGTGSIEGDRLVSQHASGSLPFAGITTGARYFFVRMAAPIGFVGGVVTGPDGSSPVASALITSNTAPFADITDGAGRFLVGGGVAVDTRVAAVQLVTLDATEAVARVPGANASVSLALTLAIVPPAVVATDPAAGAADVPLDASITIDFSEAIDPATITDQSASLQAAGVPVAVTRLLSQDGRRLVLRPAAPLSGRTTYTLIVTADVRDITGTPLGPFEPRTFSTLDPTRPPQPPPGQIVASLPDPDGLVAIAGSAGAAAALTPVTATNLRTQETATVMALADGSFRVWIGGLVGDEIMLTLRDSDGRETSVAVRQFEGSDGTTGIGLQGGTIAGPNGRAGAILPRTLTVAGTFRIAESGGPDLPALPPAFDYSDRFTLDVEGAEFNRLVSLTLTESQRRFEIPPALGPPFTTAGELTVPADFLVNSAVRYAVVAQDASGHRRTATIATTVVASGPDRAEAEAAHTADFPTVFLRAPRETVTSQVTGAAADAPTARIDLTVPAPALAPGADVFLLVRHIQVGAESRLALVDRLERGPDGRLRSSGRTLPGMTTPGEYAIVRSSEPLVFITGVLPGEQGVVEADGLPFVSDTAGPNGSFAVPMLAGAAYTLRFLTPDGSLRGTATGVAPATGTSNIGQALTPSGTPLQVAVEPAASHIVDITTSLTFRFSAPIDPRTLGTGIVITDGAGSRVFGYFSVVDQGRTVVFRPSRRWRFGTQYRYGVSTTILGLNGSRLAAPANASFSTFTPVVTGTAAIGNAGTVDGRMTLAVSGSTTGFQVVDTSAARAPRVLSATALPGGARAVAYAPDLALPTRTGTVHRGTLAAIISGDATTGLRLQLFGLDNPFAPVAYGSVPLTSPGLSDGVTDLTLVGDRALVAMQDAGLVSVPLGQLLPDAPTDPSVAIQARYPTAGPESLTGVDMLVDRIISAGPLGLGVHDGTSLNRESLAAGSFRDVASAAGFVMDTNGDGVVTSGERFDLAAATGGDDGTVHLFRVPASGAPVLVSLVRFAGETTSVSVDAARRLGFVGLGSGGFGIVDLDGPASLQPVDLDRNGVDDRILARIDTAGVVEQVVPLLERGLALVANGPAGFSVVQVLPVRSQVVSMRRDPARSVSGDEQDITVSREALTSDEAVLIDVDAFSPDGTGLVAVLNAVTATGAPVFSNTSAQLTPGRSTIAVAIDTSLANDGDVAVLTVRTASGAALASASFRLRSPGATEDAPVAIRLIPTRVALSAQQRELPLRVVATLTDGRTINVSASPETSYRVRETTVAMVSQQGVVRAVAGGTTEVDVSHGLLTASATIIVDAPAQVARIESPRPHLTLTSPGQVAPLPLTVRLSDGSIYGGDLASAGLAFTSSTPAMVSVDAAGRVTALAEGIAVVTASYGDLSVSVRVAVAFRTPASVSAITLEAFDGPAGTDRGSADARAVLAGTGSLEGTEVSFTVNGRTMSVPADYAGVAAVRLRGLTSAGTFTVVASVTDPSTGVVRTSSETVQVIARGQDVEPNDDPASAVGFELRRSVDGTVSETDTADYYRLTATEAGALKIALKLRASTGAASARIRVLDSSGAALNETVATMGTTDVTQPVSAGTVVVGVEHVSGEFTYSLAIHFDQAPVTIAGASPLTGAAGTVVTIQGAGFSLDSKRIGVYFGGVAARVLASTPTSLQVAVPAAAVDGPITVVVADRRAAGPEFVAGRQGRPSITLEPHSPEAVRFDPVYSELVVVNRLSVFFDPTMSRTDVEGVASSLNGRVAGVNEVLSRYVLEFPAVTTLPALQSVKSVLQADPRVALVTRYGFARFTQQALSDLEQFQVLIGGFPVSQLTTVAPIGFSEAFRVIRESDRFRSGLQPVTIGVIDSGFDPGIHRDEYRRANGLPVWSLRTPASSGMFEPAAPFDPKGHGTAVTSVIAPLNNGHGLSGVLGSFFTPETANFNVVIYGMDSPGAVSEDDDFPFEIAVDAITEIGLTGQIDVLNLSFGGLYIGSSWEETRDAFRLALQSFGGRTLVVAAAGNDGAFADAHLPSALEAELPFVLSVGATAVLALDGTQEPRNARAVFGETTEIPAAIRCDNTGFKGSNCEPGITIAAPGEEVLVHKPDRITMSFGTSVAAPMVTSAAALMLALRGTDEALSPEALRALLVSSGTDNEERWPGGPPLLNLRQAAQFFIRAPTNQSVYVADQDAPSPSGTGYVVAMDVDPLAGTRVTPTSDRAIPLTLTRDGTTYRFARPGAIAMDPGGQWTYVVVSAEDASLGDGILVISTARQAAEDFIAFSGASLASTPGAPRPPPVHASPGRRTIVPSKDGRLLYAATGRSITIVNLADSRIVRRLDDLPAVYRGAAYLEQPEALEQRRDALAGVLALPIGGRQATAIVGLDISADGTMLYGAVSTGGGAGLQPGALLSVTVNLYSDVTALQYGLQADLGQFFVNPTLVPMSGSGSAQGDEPSVVVAGQTAGTAYLVNGGLDGFSTIAGADEYVILLDLFGGVELARLQDEVLVGATIIRALGQTGVFAPAAGGISNIWSFAANLNYSMRPPNAGPVTHLPNNAPDVFASRPFSLAMRPDGQRAIVPMFQTGNFGVLDLDIQTRLLERNPGLTGLPADLFQGLVGVTEAIRLTPHLWPSCGVIGSGLNADAPSPDEALLFAWDAVYAQNGRFAIATHSGVGSPRPVSARVPSLSGPPGTFVMTQLGYRISGTSAVDDLGNSVGENDLITVQRGGGAVTFINDAALTDTLQPDGLRDRTPLPVHPSDLTAGNRCTSLRPGRLLGFSPSPGLTTRFHRPRGVGIQPFVYFESPRFGDHIAADQPIYIGWRDPRVTEMQLQVQDLDEGDTVVITLGLTADEIAARSLFRTLTAATSATGFEPGQRLRLTITAYATQDGGDEEEFSTTSIDVTITDGGSGLGLKLSPPLMIVPAVPNASAPQALQVTLVRPDGSSADVSADTQYQWIGQGLSESREPGFAAARAELQQALGGPSLPIAVLTVSSTGSVVVQQPGIQLIRATYQGLPAHDAVLVLAGFDLQAIAVDPQAPLAGPVTITDHLRAQGANAPLLLADGGAGPIPDQSAIVLSEVFFGYLNQGRVGIDTLLDATSRVASVREQTTISGRLREFLRLTGGSSTQTPLTYSVVARDGATGPSVDLSCATGIDTSTCVNAVASGASLVQGELDLSSIGIGRAADHVLALVLPAIESARIEPATSVIRRSDSPAAGPTIRTFAELGALPDARFTVPAQSPSADVFMSGWLPESWLTANGQVAIDVPGAVSVQFDFGLQRTATDVTVTSLRTTFAVRNDVAPDVISTYALDDSAIASLASVDSYRTRIQHQNVVGVAHLTNPVTITGLGTATATGDVIVCDCSGLALVTRLTSGATVVSSGDTVSYEITAANGTAATISNVVITDELRFDQLLVSRTTLPAFSLAPGESRSFPVSLLAPFYGTTIHKAATAPGFTATQPPPVVVLAPAMIVITEMVVNPQRDWNDSAGGNGVAFDAVPGNGTVDAGDIWIEVTGATTATQNWTIRITDASGATASRQIGPVNASTQVRVLSGFTGVTLPIVRVEVVDGQGIVRQTIDITAIEQALGGASGTGDEALAWSIFGSPTPLLQQFTRRPATPGGFSPF